MTSVRGFISAVSLPPRLYCSTQSGQGRPGCLSPTSHLPTLHLPPRCLPQVLAARESHIAELMAQIRLLADSESLRSGEQQAQLGALITSFNELRASCEQQVTGAGARGHLHSQAAAWEPPQGRGACDGMQAEHIRISYIGKTSSATTRASLKSSPRA
jgi:hypothetical protein